MSGLLIRHKIWAGYSILLVILLLIAGISLFTLSSTRNTVSAVIEDTQPTVLAAHRFNGFLAQASAALSNFLLTKSDLQRQGFQNAIYLAGEELKSIRALQGETSGSSGGQVFARLQSDLMRFQGYEAQILELVKSNLKNESALAFASETINPGAVAIQSSLTNMIVSEGDEELSEARGEWQRHIHELRYQFQKLISAVRIYLSQPTDGSRENMLAALELCRDLVAEFEPYADLYTFEQEEAIETINTTFADYSVALRQMIEINEGEQRRMDVYLLNTEILPLLERMQAEIDDFVETKSSSMTQSSVALLDEVATGFTLQGVLVVVGIFLGVAVAFVITRMVTGPLNQTVAALQDVARGDGDLTRRINVKSADEFGDLAQGFNEFSQKLQSLIVNVSECCSQLISAAQEMLDEANNTRQGVNSQNQKIDQISAAIETMTQKVRDVAGHTGEAAQLAEETNQDAREGRNVVAQSLESSDRLAADVDQAAAVINDLEQDVEAIGGILDVIRGVADQTNLLALNAAIEAARAGEQGRGFAVVADEVRTLASRTQASTAEIQTMIQRLQSGSQQAVQVMTDGRNKSQEGLEHARQAGTSLHKISSAAEGMLAMNREIAGATEAQGEQAGEINRNVAAINELARQTASSSNVMAETSGRVNELAMQLKSLIGQFRV